MKYKSLIAYLLIVTLICSGFIITMLNVGQKAFFLAQFYMLTPAVAAIITRLFFHRDKFKDANIKFGKLSDYFNFWLIGIGVTALSYILYTVSGAVSWDFSGNSFLNLVQEKMKEAGQTMQPLPPGMNQQTMLLLFFAGNLTIFSIFPGLITGFGEEFGWRGLMFPELYKIKPWVGFILGGLIWYLWHIPLVLITPAMHEFNQVELLINSIALPIGSICMFTFLAYVYIKTRNIIVGSFTHIVVNNASGAFAYYCMINNYLLANVMLSVTMMIVVAVLYYKKEFRVFKEYFKETV